MKKLSKKEETGKIKKIIFAASDNRYYYSYQNWFHQLERSSEKVMIFNPRLNKIRYGKDLMNQKFVNLVKKEEPDFIFFILLDTDEFFLETLWKLREVSPKTQTFVFLGDDDSQFESYSRYMMLFLDYGLIPQVSYIKKYNYEGINSVFYTAGLDIKIFKKIDLKKIYDVTFIGTAKTKDPKNDRKELIQLIKDNGINMHLFGFGWENFPEFKDIYHGSLSSEDLVRVLNQSRITICPSKNYHNQKTHLTARFFEGSACKTMVLTEYCKDYLDLFKENKEIVMYKDNKGLLKKINYYLNHEKEREKIVNSAYQRIISKYNLDRELKSFFDEVYEKNPDLSHRQLPKINKRIICLKNKDLLLGLEKIDQKLKDCDYVYFKNNYSKNLKFREVVQAHSLEKSGKPISCCDYYLNTPLLGDYMAFKVERTFLELGKETLHSFLDLNQLMVRKEFFLKNIDAFVKLYNNERVDFLTKDNTIFVSIPLVRINKKISGDYSKIKSAFVFKFLPEMYALNYRKKLFTSGFLPGLLFRIIKGEHYLAKALYEYLTDKNRLNRLKLLKVDPSSY